MRIAHLVDRPADIGGVQTYLAELLPALRECGIDGVVVTGDPELDEISGTPCIHSPEVSAESAHIGEPERNRVIETLRSAGVDLVYAHLARSPGVVLAAAEHAPVVFYAHDYHPVCPGTMRYLHRREAFCEEGPGLRCFWRAYTERSTNRRPDRIVQAYARVRGWRDAWPQLSRVLVASPFVADVLAADGVPRDLLRVVPYFVEPDPAPPAPVEQDVLFVGRLVAAKGAHVLLQALARLDGSPTASIAGDGPERVSLERLAERLGLEDRVRFLGWVAPTDRPRLLATSRVLAIPSLWDEPFGIVGIEGFAAGLPVVASAAGGIPSWLADGSGGLLVPRGDVEAFASALDRLLADEGFRRAQATQARAAAERFTLERHLELLLPELRAASGR